MGVGVRCWLINERGEIYEEVVEEEIVGLFLERDEVDSSTVGDVVDRVDGGKGEED